MFKCCAELWCVLNFPTANQHLRVHRFNLLLKYSFLFLRMHKLFAPLLKCSNSCIFVFLSSPSICFQLLNVRIHHVFFLLKFLFQFFKFDFIFSQESPLVHIFIYTGFIFYFFGPSCKFQCTLRLCKSFC